MTAPGIETHSRYHLTDPVRPRSLQSPVKPHQHTKQLELVLTSSLLFIIETTPRTGPPKVIGTRIGIPITGTGIRTIEEIIGTIITIEEGILITVMMMIGTRVTAIIITTIGPMIGIGTTTDEAVTTATTVLQTLAIITLTRQGFTTTIETVTTNSIVLVTGTTTIKTEGTTITATPIATLRIGTLTIVISIGTTETKTETMLAGIPTTEIPTRIALEIRTTTATIIATTTTGTAIGIPTLIGTNGIDTIGTRIIVITLLLGITIEITIKDGQSTPTSPSTIHNET